jgi:hypothetical protein
MELITFLCFISIMTTEVSSCYVMAPAVGAEGISPPFPESTLSLEGSCRGTGSQISLITKFITNNLSICSNVST